MAALTTEKIIEIVFFSFFTALFIPGGILFFLRRRHEPIHSRGYFLALFQMVTAAIDLGLRSIDLRGYSCLAELIRASLILLVWVYPFFLRCTILWFELSQQQFWADKDQLSPAAQVMVVFFSKRKFLLDWRGKIGMTLLMIIFGLTVTIPAAFTNPISEDCSCQAVFRFLLFQAVFALLLILFFIYLLWGRKDSFLIKQELASLFVIGLPMLALWAISSTLGWKGWAFVDFWVNLCMLGFLFATIFMPLVASFYYDRWIGKRVKRSPSEGMGSEKSGDELHLVFAIPELMADFERFAIESWTYENVLFYNRVERFKSLQSQEKAKQEAALIFEEFLKRGSKYEINVDMMLTEELMEKIQEGKITFDLFDGTQAHVFELLRFSVFPLWKRTAGFKKTMENLKAEDLQELRMSRQTRKNSKANISMIDISIRD